MTRLLLNKHCYLRTHARTNVSFLQIDECEEIEEIVLRDNTHVQEHLTPVAMPTGCHILDSFLDLLRINVSYHLLH